MMHGEVNEDLEAVIPIRLYGPHGDFEDFEVVIDTGFSGTLIINEAIVNSLQLDFFMNGAATLADGSRIAFPQYKVEMEWFGKRKKIVASTINHDFLFGMKLLAGHQLFIDVQPGGKVGIQ